MAAHDEAPAAGSGGDRGDGREAPALVAAPAPSTTSRGDGGSHDGWSRGGGSHDGGSNSSDGGGAGGHDGGGSHGSGD